MAAATRHPSLCCCPTGYANAELAPSMHDLNSPKCAGVPRPPPALAALTAPGVPKPILNGVLNMAHRDHILDGIKLTITQEPVPAPEAPLPEQPPAVPGSGNGTSSEEEPSFQVEVTSTAFKDDGAAATCDDSGGSWQSAPDGEWEEGRRGWCHS